MSRCAAGFVTGAAPRHGDRAPEIDPRAPRFSLGVVRFFEARVLRVEDLV